MVLRVMRIMIGKRETIIMETKRIKTMIKTMIIVAEVIVRVVVAMGVVIARVILIRKGPKL